MKIIKCNYFVHGSDWKTNIQSSQREELIKIMKSWKGKVIEPTYTKHISSSILKKKFHYSK